MLRPEAIHLSRASDSPVGGAQVNILQGQVQEGHYMGAFTEYLVQAAGTILKVHSTLDIQPGSDILVTFAAMDCRLVVAPEKMPKAA
jgi:iron(III) transport system ATP-binding protein